MVASTDVDGLTPSQEQAIVALLSYPGIKAAAAACGIGERTLHTWLDEPAFIKAFRKARRQTFQQAISMCQKATPVAVQALYKIVSDPASKQAVTVAAATAIMKFGRESIELDELAARLEALEAAASMDKQQEAWRG